jgi:tRNA U34 5-methylaminomethyl-2-thiouridine-forming methyltransferase MnmC
MAESFVPHTTADGSFTFFSPEFGEFFHNRHGACLEARAIYVDAIQLAAIAQKPTVCLLDVCYGLGYNTAAALETIWAVNPTCEVQWFGLELNLTVPQAAIAHNLLTCWQPEIQQILCDLAQTQVIESDRLQAQLLLGDARQTLQFVHSTGFQADAIFLDPFSPPHCPQLWTVEFLDLVARCLKPDGKLATYSCAAAVRTSLRQAGLHIGSLPGVGRQSPGTIASFNADLPLLSLAEQEHLKTRAAVPYRDPTLSDPADTILQRRIDEQETCGLEPTSQWRKRWRAKN